MLAYICMCMLGRNCDVLPCTYGGYNKIAGIDTMLPSCSSLALNSSHKAQLLGPLSNKPSLCPHIWLLFPDLYAIFLFSLSISVSVIDMIEALRILLFVLLNIFILL